MTEDWSSVFMQALQNSIAQAKAEQKWNQELDFRNKQLAEDARQYNETSKYNYAIFDESKATNRANWLSKYAPAPTNWDTNFGQYFGAAVQNPYGGGDAYYVPYTSLENVQRAREEDQKRADFYRTNYSNVEPSKTGYAIPDSMLNIGMLDSANLASPLSKALETNFPTGNLYLNSANSSAKELAGRMKIADDANATQLAGIYANIAHEDKWKQKEYDSRNRGAYIVRQGNQEFYVNNTTPEEIEKQYPNSIRKRITDDQGYSGAIYQSNKKLWDKRLKDASNESAIAALLDELIQAGANPADLPMFRISALNKLDELNRDIYNQNPQRGFWGNFFQGLAPRTATDYDVNEARSKGLVNSDYYRALDVLNNYPAFGAQPKTILGN